MVFLHHFVPVAGKWSGIDMSLMAGELHIGVTFFFVLSGFLIHHRYGQTPAWEWPVFKSYFLARVARILPLFFILNAATFAVLLWQGDKSIAKTVSLFLVNATLLKGFFSGLKFSGIPQSWSLTVEFCFYAFAPILFSRVRNPLLYPRVAFILLVTGFGLVALFSSLPVWSFFGDNRFMLSYSFLGRSFEFFMGCYLSSQFRNWSETRSEGGFFTWFGFSACVLTLYILSTFRQPAIYGVHTFPGLLVNNFFLPVAIILFFRGLLFEKTLLSAVLGSPLFVKLGKASYAFYLIHVGIIQKAIAHGLSSLAAWKVSSPALRSLFGFMYEHAVLVQFFALNLISWWLYSLLEEPLNLYFRRKIKTMKPTGLYRRVRHLIPGRAPAG